MARRDLSRTVIEGGRYRFAKFLRRSENAAARADQRAWLDAVRVDPDIADDSGLDRVIKRNRVFYDKLAVTRRWLRSQCGRPWNDVFSELMTRFDPRTVAGQHIVFDHMLQDVLRAPDPHPHRRYRFEVDEDGILRTRGTRARRRAEPRAPVWSNHRWAVKHDGVWWWVGDRLVGPCVQLPTCRYHHHYRGGVPHHYTRATLLGRMTPTEVGRLMSLPIAVHDVVLWRRAWVRPDAAPLARP